MHELRQLGSRLAVDDFGTGYSSLGYIQQFEFDVLKIDKSFVDDIDQFTNQRIVTAVLDLARQLGVRTIAEGIETEVQDGVLRELGCRYGQGYLYSRPVAETDFRELLANERAPSGEPLDLAPLHHVGLTASAQCLRRLRFRLLHEACKRSTSRHRTGRMRCHLPQRLAALGIEGSSARGFRRRHGSVLSSFHAGGGGVQALTTRQAHFLKSVSLEIGQVASSVSLLTNRFSSKNGTKMRPKGGLLRPRVSTLDVISPLRVATLTLSPRCSPRLSCMRCG